MDNNVDLREIDIREEVGHTPTITVVGVGGGGNNTIAHLIRTGTYQNIRLMIANTDLQHMQNSPAKNHIILGKKLTKGLGAGMKPEKGREAAEECYDEIKQSFNGSDLIIISAGLGGGTGTGAAPIFAKAAKEIGALTIAVVTKPFAYEGARRAKLAEEGLKELYEVCDSIVVIPNQKLLSVIGKNTGYRESMGYVDDVVARAVNGISSVMLNNSNEGINVDFQDLCTIMDNRGYALMGIGEAEGEDAAEQAVRNAIESPLFDNMSINGCMGAIVNYEFHPEFPFYAISTSMEIIQEAASEDAHIIFGTMPREGFDPNRVRVSIIATGFKTGQTEAILPQRTPSTVEVSMPQETLPTLPTADTQMKPDIFPNFTQHKEKVSSGDYNEDELDEPTYLRYKKD
ncbi:cell division protein FtsZ [Helicobacter didelphidarum]|uniref:Cell division protein FtsZ n=1 Tax=Helicobacter didelphidarum TaxID=2040648 RepID=A0A3D8IPC4_9HELI|nr:cell division protein FtsZ [Helicobacter didelphidarum]RDU67147.1 cell division protein FtsZ [Helicobacter didelphidarum]